MPVRASASQAAGDVPETFLFETDVTPRGWRCQTIARAARLPRDRPLLVEVLG